MDFYMCSGVCVYEYICFILDYMRDNTMMWMFVEVCLHHTVPTEGNESAILFHIHISFL